MLYQFFADLEPGQFTPLDTQWRWLKNLKKIKKGKVELHETN